MNGIFFALVCLAFAVGAGRELFGFAAEADMAPMQALTAAVIDGAGSAVHLAINLIGVMALFLGVMKVAEAAGVLVIIARLVRPLMTRLFPDVPAAHPAMGAMILNISANILGLGNAATPFGIRAMQELDRLNTVKGTASNAMVLFLAINTSSVTLLPTGVISLRAAAGSLDPAGIVPTTLFATICSTAVAIVMAKLTQRYWPTTPADGAAAPVAAPASPPNVPATGRDDTAAEAGFETTAGAERAGSADAERIGDGYHPAASFAALAGVVALIPLSVIYGRAVAPWIIPGLIVVLLGFGAVRRVRIYEVFIEGARDGFQVAIRIIPYLVAILVAVAMFRASGALALIVTPLGQLTGPLGLPAEALPMALLRPLSGSGAYGVLASIINDPAIGPDSYTGYLASTIQGSTETTFYVLAVYFGAVGIRRIRHAIVTALTADAAGVAAAVLICRILHG
ncbi:MAG: spore maturation protein [Rhodospirillales bacterium]|nr:spore maturation protein [Rhodospirillales bacterium]